MNTPQQEDMERSLREAKEALALKLRGYANEANAIAAQFYVMGGHPVSIAMQEKFAVLNAAADLLSPAQRSSNPQQEKDER